MARSPFPLAWPDGWKRAAWRQDSKFDRRSGSFNASRDNVLHRLKRMGASHVVITSNLPVNSKGVPYSSAVGLISDPGIAVWWVKNGKEHAIACDRWRSTYENMHAIELSLEAMAGLDRWGANEIVEKAFAGFAALPAAGGTNGAYAHGDTPENYKRTWEEVFKVTSDAYGALQNADLLVIVRARHRDMIKAAHPDAGGSHELAAELNAALVEAEKALVE